MTELRSPDRGVDLDPEALREKYREERDRRLRPEPQRSYRYAEGSLASFAGDPYADEPAPREAVSKEVDVLVVGGGFGGIMAATALVEAGVENVQIVEIAADFGGTWYWNRYPGVRCDIEACVYLPLLEETGYRPTERYVTGEEIFAYCQLLARRSGLYERALLQTRVESMRWDEPSRRWTVATSMGDELRARFVVTQSGVFLNPQLPAIEGIEEFGGPAFHTARWDYEYTGGSPSEPLSRLADKRVGVIGTGATGLQVIPAVAESAQRLTVFQRTPTAVNVRDNAPIEDEWFESQKPGWHRERVEAFTQATAAGVPIECPVDDGWTRFFRHIFEAGGAAAADGASPEEIEAAVERADFEWNEMLRARVEETVADPDKAAKLKAYYRALCKRPGFSDDYLPALARDNVELVDTSATPIERITPAGVIVDGVEHEFDCLIFATGFELGTSWAHQAGYDLAGEVGPISEVWGPGRGMKTLYGLFSHEFPNVFFMGLAQTAVTVNATHILGEQAKVIALVASHCLAEGVERVRASAAAQDHWQQVMREKSAERRSFQRECTPGYFNAEGRPEDPLSTIASGIYSPATEFIEKLDEWREAREFKGLELD